MNKFAYAVLALAGLAMPALAEEPAPQWNVNEMCATAKLDQMCLRVENENRQAVLARWNALPVADRSACEQQFDQPGQRSYKRLLNCIDDRAMKALEDSSDHGHNG